MRSLIVTVVAAALIGVAVPDRAAAQREANAADRSLLAWGSTRVLVFADTLDGLFVWLDGGRPTSATTENGQSARRFVGSFDPEQVQSWANKSLGLLDAPAPPAGDTGTTFGAVLQGRDSAAILVARARNARNWGPMLSVSFVSRGKTPFVVRLHPRNVRELIESMFTHAGWSVLKSSDSASTDSTIFAEEALDTAHAAKLLPPLRSPRYPTQLQTRGVPGEVWARYVIDTTGRMEPGSVEVLYTTNPLFAENAIQALKDQRFTPARRYGRPVRMQAYRTWSFIVPGI